MEFSKLCEFVWKDGSSICKICGLKLANVEGHRINANCQGPAAQTAVAAAALAPQQPKKPCNCGKKVEMSPAQLAAKEQERALRLAQRKLIQKPS